MSVATVAWAAIIGTVVYVLVVEPLFFDHLLLQTTRLTQLIEMQWVRLAIHPESPWVRAKDNRNANRIATQLLKEVNDRPAREPDDDNHPG